MKHLLLSITIALLMSGCGTWVEITTITDPNTGIVVVEVLYENRRPWAPENATVKAPGGWEIHLGEQASQNAATGKLTDTIMFLSGVGGGQ